MELQLARSLRILHHVLLKVGLILQLGLLKLRFPNVIRPRIILIIFLFALYLSTFYYLLSVSIYFLLIFISLPIYCYLSSQFFLFIFSIQIRVVLVAFSPVINRNVSRVPGQIFSVVQLLYKLLYFGSKSGFTIDLYVSRCLMYQVIQLRRVLFWEMEYNHKESTVFYGMSSHSSPISENSLHINQSLLILTYPWLSYGSCHGF